ncbi:MAG: prepilin-type N-terminal cleavage/methylation domain-containing protein [Candidatus Omnitrophota bacterium]
MSNKKGFTLLELIIVIIIIGILATLAVSQYSRIIEKSRSAEARAIIGSIRQRAAAIYFENANNCTTCTDINLGIGIAAAVKGGDYPGPVAANCFTSQYFWYKATAGANGVVIKATRCATGGKTPDGDASDTVQLTSDFTPAGGETWLMTGRYL